MHDHLVSRIHVHPRHMAHHVGGEFAGELAAVGVATQELCILSAIHDPHQSKVDLRCILHVLEILARAGDDEVLPLQFGTLAGSDVIISKSDG